MKLTLAALTQHLATSLSPIYLISGDEWLLKQEACNLIRKKAKACEVKERIRLPLDANFSWENLYQFLYTSSLLSEKRLIELHFAESLPPKTVTTLLEEYAKKIDKNHILLINMGKVDSKITKSTWYQAIENIGVVVTIWPLLQEELPGWIMKRAKKYQLNMEQGAALLLSEWVEGNLIAAHQAIEKLYLLKPSSPINEETIKEVLIPDARFSIFTFIDSMLQGNTSKTLYILETLREEGLEPAMIVWGIARELRVMAAFLRQKQNLVSDETLFHQYRIFPRRQATFKRFVKAHSLPQCLNLIKKVSDMDQMIKGAKNAHIWDALQLFCLRMST